MSAEVLFSPKPQRSLKRALADLDSDALHARKHARQSSLPLPTPSTIAQRSKNSRLQSFENLHPRHAPPRNCRRPQSLPFEPTDDQYLQITRSGSAPPWPNCAPGSSRYCHPQLGFLRTVLHLGAKSNGMYHGSSVWALFICYIADVFRLNDSITRSLEYSKFLGALTIMVQNGAQDLIPKS